MAFDSCVCLQPHAASRCFTRFRTPLLFPNVRQQSFSRRLPCLAPSFKVQAPHLSSSKLDGIDAAIELRRKIQEMEIDVRKSVAAELKTEGASEEVSNHEDQRTSPEAKLLASAILFFSLGLLGNVFFQPHNAPEVYFLCCTCAALVFGWIFGPGFRSERESVAVRDSIAIDVDELSRLSTELEFSNRELSRVLKMLNTEVRVPSVVKVHDDKKQMLQEAVRTNAFLCTAASTALISQYSQSLSSMSVKDLRGVARDMGLKVSGTKEILLERISSAWDSAGKLPLVNR